MRAHERHRTRTLWLTGVLHGFTHLYGVALLPLYLRIQQDLKLSSVEPATLLVTVQGGRISPRATRWECWRTD